jgi:hexosaminidase
MDNMKRGRIYCITLACVFAWTACAINSISGNPALAKESLDPTLALIPWPEKVVCEKETFLLSSVTAIRTDPQMREVGHYLAEVMRTQMGLNCFLEKESVGEKGKISILTASPAEHLGDEGYRLEIKPDCIVIRAGKAAGAFYGCQTLRQLLSPGMMASPTPATASAWTMPCLTIEDKPRFAWRGLMLDPARYFLPLDLLKHYVDLMASYKLNRLQLHLTDDLGWTLEIQKYPELTDMSLWPMRPANRNRGIYTQAQMRELVAYAAQRHVMIVPEIEMPGHNGVPGWALRDKVLCSNNPYRDSNKAWDEKETHKWVEPCVASPAAQEVYENILSEVIDVFPSPYIHLGGDEYFGLAWDNCPACQKLIETENLRENDSVERKRLFSNCLGSKEKYLLYGHLMRRMCRFVTSKGRQPILWDDLSWQGDFPEDVTIMQWHYEGGGDAWQRIRHTKNPAAEAVKAGRDAVIAPYSHLYFDLGSTLKAVFHFDPLPAGLTDEQQKKILGPHAPVWEQPPQRLDARVFPRFYGLAEIAWSPSQPRDWPGFSQRVSRHEALREPFGLSGRLVGRWTPGQMKPREQKVELSWNVGGAVRAAGVYEIVLTYQSGSDGISIDWVSLRENGKEISRDTHLGWSGATLKDIVYTVTCDTVNPQAVYTVHAQLWIPQGGTNSTGNVTIAPKR